jgi:hypothetical protein
MWMYGQVADLAALDWAVVEERLARAPTYWVTAASRAHPHSRPVWGVWLDDALHLSIGSPLLAGQLGADDRVTVHLDSGTEVVIVEGRTTRPAHGDGPDALIAAYDAKYDWHYSVEEYSPFTTVTPSTVMAWDSGGWAGRDGFQRGAKWVWS